MVWENLVGQHLQSPLVDITKRLVVESGFGHTLPELEVVGVVGMEKITESFAQPRLTGASVTEIHASGTSQSRPTTRFLGSVEIIQLESLVSQEFSHLGISLPREREVRSQFPRETPPIQ